MSFPKILIVGVVGLFGFIVVAGLVKGRGDKDSPAREPVAFSPEVAVVDVAQPQEVAVPSSLTAEQALPDADRIDEFFNTGDPKLPIVETVVYSRKVPWLQGKAAWVVDYAKYYQTSRHFIARSLNGGPNYEDQRVANGDRFNVFRKDRPVSFHLLVDTSRCRMWVYYLDEADHERVLVKTYNVGLGRVEPKRGSGLLTPHGTYTLGDNIAVYRDGTLGLHEGERIEMRRVFGTRWIPFDQEVCGCTAPPRGLGLHGCPWGEDGFEDVNGLGSYESDGCIRLATADMEELFSVVITKPTTIYLVPDFYQVELPGEEKTQ